MATKTDASNSYVWGKRKNKKWIAIIAAIVLVVAAGAGYALFGIDWDKDSTTPAATNAETDTGTLTRRALDGVRVAADQANAYPVGVMVENLVSVRPQSGLTDASVVYEALAEGGITRFLALYADLGSSEIGPVRSARPYFVDWNLEYDALYAHAGGSPQALADIQTHDVFDLNQFTRSQFYWRDSSRSSASEHTLFTSGEKLTYALRDLEAPAEGSFRTWKFKDELAEDLRPEGEQTITIDYSSLSYRVEYRYDRASNSYVRYQGGQPHVDRSGATVQPKNVIVQKMRTYLVDQQRLGMDTVGEGEAIIFRDGKAITGRWAKEATDQRTIFYGSDDLEVELNAGPTWVQVVPTDRDVTYTGGTEA